MIGSRCWMLGSGESLLLIIFSLASLGFGGNLSHCSLLIFPPSYWDQTNTILLQPFHATRGKVLDFWVNIPFVTLREKVIHIVAGCMGLTKPVSDHPYPIKVGIINKSSNMIIYNAKSSPSFLIIVTSASSSNAWHHRHHHFGTKMMSFLYVYLCRTPKLETEVVQYVC